MAEFCMCFNRCLEVSEYSKNAFLNRTDPNLLIPSISFSNSPNLDLDVITLQIFHYRKENFKHLHSKNSKENILTVGIGEQDLAHCPH